MPKLSIITINLNNLNGLEKTIESVKQQMFCDYEFIIIDGGSTEGSLEVIKLNSDIISFWVSEPDTGIFNAMNKGIKKAKGEYCLFLNSGDYFRNSNVLQLLFSNGYAEDIVYSDMMAVLNEKEIYSIKYPDKLTFEQFFNNTLGHQATIIKRSLFEKIGLYNERNKYASDWEFFLMAIIKNNVSYRHFPFFLTCYDTSGISSQKCNNEEMVLERMSILKNEFPFYYDDYLALRIEKEYHEMVRSRSFIKRVRDLGLYIIKASNFDR